MSDRFYAIGHFMEKVVLYAFICLMGLSAQASQDEVVPQHLMHEHFLDNKEHITREDIQDAMKRFPTFLRWTYSTEANGLITHLVARYGNDPDVLSYLLGFSPGLYFFVDGNGRYPEDICKNQELKEVFERYRENPWRHPPQVFDLPVDHQEYIYDGKRYGEKEDVINNDNDPSGRLAFFSKVVEKKVLGLLGTMILSVLIYRYNTNKDKEQSAEL